MRPRIILRRRFFIAVEGESERSFVTWLQRLSEDKTHIHLEVEVLGGGGYESMLRKAAEVRRRASAKGKFKASFLILDADRAAQSDWSVERLRQEVAVTEMNLCLQTPNHEGMLLRLIEGKENQKPGASQAKALLKQHWPAYEKPMNANNLSLRFKLADLLRAAKVDPDLMNLIHKIGLCD